MIPDYYDNTDGSLYKLAHERGWNAYIFDIVKRLERGGKKDPLSQEIEKSIVVLKLFREEINPLKNNSQFQIIERGWNLYLIQIVKFLENNDIEMCILLLCKWKNRIKKEN